MTRPAHDAQEVSDLLGQRGFQVLLEPMLDIKPLPAGPLDLNGVQALVGTSANGVRALAAATQTRDLPLFAVGDATARLARKLGFAQVFAAQGEVESLGRLIKSSTDPRAGALLHAAGTVSAGDLAGDLSQTGHELRRVILYEAIAAPKISERLRQALLAETLDVALFFSPRTASSFVNLIDQAGLSKTTQGLEVFALSANVAHALRVLPWARVHVAAQPSMIELMRSFDAAYPSGAAPV